jgi:hypothetical protein
LRRVKKPPRPFETLSTASFGKRRGLKPLSRLENRKEGGKSQKEGEKRRPPPGVLFRPSEIVHSTRKIDAGY